MFKEMRTGITYGTSFSPEYCEQIGSENPLELLKIVHEELNIKDIRFGMRWNRVEDSNGKLSLSYYDPYIKYLLKKKCKICLNVGPIKTFRWPEEYVPSQLEHLKVRLLKPEDELAKYSYEYLHSLLSLLKEEYGDKIRDISFQLENEAFNRFGHLGIVMSQDHMVCAANILSSYFPGNRLMINSAGRRNWHSVVNLFKRLSEEKIYSGGSLILGLNYYFRIPHTLPFFKRIEPLKYSFPGDMSLQRLHSLRKGMGFGLEVSEGQFEPWTIQKSPGNSYEDFEYLIEKCNSYFPDRYLYKLLRLWGTEELALKMKNNVTSEVHERLIGSIRGDVDVR